MPNEMRPESLRPRPDFAPPTDRGGGEPERKIAPERLVDLVIRATRDTRGIKNGEEKTKVSDVAIDAINKLENAGYSKLAKKLQEYKGQGLVPSVDGTREVRHALSVLKDSLEGDVDNLDRDEAMKTLSDLGVEVSDVLTVMRERRDKQAVEVQERERTEGVRYAKERIEEIEKFESLDPRKARRDKVDWLREYEGKPGVDKAKTAEVRKSLNLTGADMGKQTELNASVKDELGKLSEESEKLRTEIRMAMIKDIGDKMSADPENKFDSFYKVQVGRYGGPYKNHFDIDYEVELREEYTARAELAHVMNYWDSGPKMVEEDLKRCSLLSKSTYEWLAREKVLGYKKEEHVEIVEGGNELREQMDKVATDLYGKMMRGELDTWIIRGEDRLAKYDELARELKVSIDAVRLTWQLAEAECWQARMRITHISHSAGKLVVASDYRDFATRKAKDVPGSTRLWIEWLRDHENVYPEAGKDIYKNEGRRLARVGFEAWVIRVVDDKEKKNGKEVLKDHRNEKYRDGVVFLFSEGGGTPAFLGKLGADLFITGKKGQGVNVDNLLFESGCQKILSAESDQEKRKKLSEKLESVLGGERALIAGEYLQRLEALLAQPGFGDVDLPQKITMDDLSRAASVHEAIEAFGKIDATKATTEELEKLRRALEGQYFRFQSNDLIRRLDADGKDNSKRTIVIKEGISGEESVNEWTIPGSNERMAKARIRVGELMEEWSRTFVFLMSWENPSHKSEGRVVGMRDWIYLAREIARAYDSQHQWGSYIGYGYGNYDKNELATLTDGKTSRIGPTTEMKVAAERYRKWFDFAFYRNRKIVKGKKFNFTVTKVRADKEANELGEYSEGFVFWRGSWWGRPTQDL